MPRCGRAGASRPRYRAGSPSTSCDASCTVPARSRCGARRGARSPPARPGRRSRSRSAATAHERPHGCGHPVVYVTWCTITSGALDRTVHALTPRLDYEPARMRDDPARSGRLPHDLDSVLPAVDDCCLQRRLPVVDEPSDAHVSLPISLNPSSTTSDLFNLTDSIALRNGPAHDQASHTRSPRGRLRDARGRDRDAGAQHRHLCRSQRVYLGLLGDEVVEVRDERIRALRSADGAHAGAQLQLGLHLDHVDGLTYTGSAPRGPPFRRARRPIRPWSPCATLPRGRRRRLSRRHAHRLALHDGDALDDRRPTRPPRPVASPPAVVVSYATKLVRVIVRDRTTTSTVYARLSPPSTRARDNRRGSPASHTLVDRRSPTRVGSRSSWRSGSCWCSRSRSRA